MSSSQHKVWSALLAGPVAVAMVVSLGLAGCAGNGEGLDSNGVPIGSGGGSGGGGSGGGGTGAVTADFQSIQDNVFTPICSPCHSGGGAPEGLMLDAAHSYNLLVGIASAEVPSLQRVKPGDPDSSYIIIKLTNGPGIVGAQMPRGEPPLPQPTIDAIRQWITNGAPQASASASPAEAMQKLQQTVAQAAASSSPFKVNFTSPVDGAVVESPVRQILVVFNHEVDASLVNYTNLTVQRVDPAGVADTGAGGSAQLLAMPSYFSLAEGNASTVVIKPVAPLVPGTYRVSARGSGGGVIADLNAQALAGDYSFTFTVDASP
jgi:methionine-rich copper-binding protein CopC